MLLWHARDNLGGFREMNLMNISRRSFVTTTAAGLGALATKGKADYLHDEFVEALVIGSGFGGAIAALRLAEAGVRTVVLERGIRYRVTPAGDTFTTFEIADGRSSWLSKVATGLDPKPIEVPYTGVMELIGPTGNTDPSVNNGNRIISPNIIIRNGSCVGGGSVSYNAIMLQPTRELFRQVFPRAINFDELDEVYYPRVRSVLGCSEIPLDILN